MKRRHFIKKGTMAASVAPVISIHSCKSDNKASAITNSPIVLSTWDNKKANLAAYRILAQNGSALDAIEAGIHVLEADPEEMTVGYGGRPDREGKVTLDACIMDHLGNAGSVTFLENIKHPISVARKVMEETPHVILSGKGAYDFAIDQGFPHEDLLTQNSIKEYKEWKIESKYEPKVNIERHDTIGMLAMDAHGDLSGGCSTSGLGYKMHGRVGDSPIIGAGLFVDNEIGAATATGMGELVIRSVGSFLIVELMRQGLSPYEACKEGVMRIVRKQDYSKLQVGYLAMNKKGEIGAYSLKSGFVYAMKSSREEKTVEVEAYTMN